MGEIGSHYDYLPNMNPTKKIPWQTSEITKLIDLWGRDEPIFLISLELNRTMGSVTTQASRCALPIRDIDAVRHRKRWTPREETLLNHIVVQQGSLEVIQDFAKACGRSLDAVILKITDKFGNESLSHIIKQNNYSCDLVDVSLLSPVTRNKNELKCMKPGCGNIFLSPDRTRVRHCPKCRKNYGYDDYN